MMNEETKAMANDIAMPTLEEEEAYSDWLESIVFIGGNGKPLSVVLSSDESADSEGDRGE